MPRPGPDIHALLDPGASAPIHRQLARVLSSQIVARQFGRDGMLPREQDLAGTYGVSRGTVRGALAQLEQGGLIRRVRGKGTYIVFGEDAPPRWQSTADTVLFVQLGPSRDPAPDGYYRRIQKGARQAVANLGFHLQTTEVYSPVEVPLVSYDPPQPEQVRGAILCGTFDRRYINMFCSRRVPTVIVDYHSHTLSVDSVCVDVEAEAYTIIDRLSHHGHTRIALSAVARLRAPSTKTYEMDPDVWRFLDALRRAASQHGVQVCDDWVIAVPPDGLAVRQAFRSMMANEPTPTAIVCFDVQSACEVLSVLDAQGMSCPDDVSLMLRNWLQPFEIRGRAVTGLQSDPVVIGQTAGRLLVERIRGHRQHGLAVAVASRYISGTTLASAPRDSQ